MAVPLAVSAAVSFAALQDWLVPRRLPHPPVRLSNLLRIPARPNYPLMRGRCITAR